MALRLSSLTYILKLLSSKILTEGSNGVFHFLYVNAGMVH